MTAFAVAIVLLAVLVALPFRSGMYALFAVVALRSLCDYGLIDTSRIGVLSGLSTILPLVAIASGVCVGFSGRLSAIVRWIVAIGAFLVLWMLVAIVQFGIRESLIQESIRLLSVVAVVAVAYSVSSNGDLRRNGAYAAGLSIPALSVALLGAGAGLSHMAVNDRYTFTFSHPNAAGVFFGVSVLVALCAAFSTGRRWAWVLALTSLVLLGMTASLTSVIATAVGAVVLVCTSRQLTTARKFQFGMLGTVVSVVVVQVLGISQRFDEFSQASRITNSPDSFQWRLENWRLLYEQWLSAKMVGFGTGTTNSIINPLGGPPHNVYVQLLVEYGLVGLSAAVCLAVAAARKSFLLVRSGAGELYAAPFALTVFMAINALAGNTLGYTAAVYLVAAVVGLAFGEDYYVRHLSGTAVKMAAQRQILIPSGRKATSRATVRKR